MEGTRGDEGTETVEAEQQAAPAEHGADGRRAAPADETAGPRRRRLWPRRGAHVAGVPGARTHIPASRGAVTGILLVVLGLWGALIPLVGPYFGYEFGSDSTWVVTWQRAWLDIVPGAALVIGGLILLVARRRPAGVVGAWIALVGGVWFVVGPTVSILWHGELSMSAPIGAPIGSKDVKFLEFLGYFYGLGALTTALAAFALGRLSIVGVRDVEVAAERTGTTATLPGTTYDE